MVDADTSVEWRMVQGHPLYEISEHGVIRLRVAHHQRPKHWPAGHVIKQYFSGVIYKRKDGSFKDQRYYTVTLYHPDYPKGKFRLVHRLVCEAFHGTQPTKFHVVAHYDGNRLNNNRDNVRWATHSENVADSIRHGTCRTGVSNSGAKLSESDVYEIRREIKLGTEKKYLGKKYRVDGSVIRRIGKRLKWAHLPEMPDPGMDG